MENNIKGLKVALHNLGCKVNSYEMDVMIQKLVDAGCIIVPFNEKADVYIINTCTVTNIADRKSRQMLHRSKKENPDAIKQIHKDYMEAGANVVMPNLSPTGVRNKYMLYDNKICTGEEAAECIKCMSKRVECAGYHLVEDRGDHVLFKIK